MMPESPITPEVLQLPTLRGSGEGGVGDLSEGGDALAARLDDRDRGHLALDSAVVAVSVVLGLGALSVLCLVSQWRRCWGASVTIGEGRNSDGRPAKGRIAIRKANPRLSNDAC